MSIKSFEVDENLIFEIEATEITVKDNRPRQRKELGEIQKMAESIAQFGQLLPILIDRDKGLVAGGRRLTACMLLGRKARVCYKDSVDEVFLQEVELEENLQRKALTPAEESLAIQSLINIKQKKFGVGTRGKEGGYTLSDAAEFIGKTKGSVIESLEIARAVEMFPNLAECKTKSEIKKAVRGLERTQKHMAALQNYNSTVDATDDVILVNRVAKDWLKGVPEKAVDLFFTDPPYGIDIHEVSMTAGGATGGEVTTTGVKYEDKWEAVVPLLENLITESFRVTNDTGHAYFFCGRDRFIFNWMYDKMTEAGWDVLKWPIIWVKRDTGQNNQPGHWPSSAYEAVLFARKPESELVLQGRPDWIQCNIVSPSERLHQAEKPVLLCKELISRTCLPGQRMIDACMGSGALVAAAKELKIYVMGCEKDIAIYASAVVRMEKLKNG